MAKFLSLFNRRIVFLVLTVLGVMLFAFSYSAVWNTQAVEEEENEGANIAEYFKYRFDQMKDSSGAIPAGAQINALRQRAAMAQQRVRAPRIAGIDNLSWTAVGPGNVGGRVRAILPINATTVFVGGVSGGIWKTSNCCSTGTTWTPINDFMANLAVSSLIVDPTNANTLYAGTGEGFYNADAVRGAGVFKSTDGGNTWTQLANTNNSNWYYVNRLAISPNGATLLAATRTGIWRSTDGGTNWTRVNTTSDMRDVRFNPSDNTKAVAAQGYLSAYYSTDGGVTWTAATGLPSSTDWLARIELAYAPSNPSIVYAGLNQNSGELWKSTDGGVTYALVNTGTSYMSNQGWYNNTIWVNPTNANNVVVAGLDIYKSTDGGTTLTKISRWQNSWGYRNPPSPHADHHALVSIPPGSSTSLMNGNDGGLYYTSNIATAGTNADFNSGWVYLNNNLNITQFYGVAGNATGVVFGGSQDNGVTRFTSAGGANAWTFANGGDGGESAIDPADSNYLYNEYTYGTVSRSSNGGTSVDDIYGVYYNGSAWVCRNAPYRIDDACNSTASFIAPILLDPNNTNRLLVGGLSLWVTNDVKTPYVWNSATGGPQWTAIKSSITSNITAVAVAPGDSNIIWVGYRNGRIDMTTNGGTNWTQVDTNIGASKPTTQIGSIAIDKNNNNVVYVGFTGFGANRAWRTANGGTAWTNITNNLPQTPIYAFAINPSNSTWLYVGTETGIFASVDSGTTWNVPSGTGMNGDGPANVATFDLQWVGGGNSTGTPTLIAGTHGRGAFKADTAQAVSTYANTYADPTGVCASNTPCYTTIANAISNVQTNGTVTIYAGNYGENVTVNKTATVNVVGNITINNLDLSAATWNAGSSTMTVNGNWVDNRTSGNGFSAGTSTVIFGKNGVATLSLPKQTGATVTFCNLTINSSTTLDSSDDLISAATGGSCTLYTQSGKLRREAPTQNINTSSTFTFKDAWNRDAVQLTKTGAGADLGNTAVTVTSNQLPTTCGSSSLGGNPVLRLFDILPSNSGSFGPYTVRLYFNASNPNESNGNTTTNPYSLAIYHCNNTIWEKIPGTGGSDSNGVYVEATGVGAFSPFAIGGGSGAPTAVGIESFAAQSADPGLPWLILGVGFCASVIAAGAWWLRRR